MKEKSILMSIRPQYVAKILNGEKTIEVRKKFPKDYVGWVYIYCTKSKPYLIPKSERNKAFWEEKEIDMNTALNGKVVARFWCDKVEEIYCQLHFNGFALETDTMNRDTLNKKSYLTDKELREYFNRGVYTFNETYGYAIHISKLEVFDKPKELKEFKHWVAVWQYCGMDCPPYVDDELRSLYKAPQSWCYVEDTL